MNWQPLLVQVEEMMDSSLVTLHEFKEIIQEERWFENPVWSNESWWFGEKSRKSYQTFQQMHDYMRDWMGMGKDALFLMDALRYQISRTVDELIANDHMVETNEMVEEDVAA